MNDDYPVFDENAKSSSKNHEAKEMNGYIAKSVDFALTLHKPPWPKPCNAKPTTTPPPASPSCRRRIL